MYFQIILHIGALGQSFSISTVLTFWPISFFVVRAILWITGCSAEFLISTNHPTSQTVITKTVPNTSECPQGTKLSQLANTALGEIFNTSPPKKCTHVLMSPDVRSTNI